eukprot:CAMPEP_0179159502 /NCGR_PEP_ID=MMETSP0796-20121207/77909_1 /TAXON_ID=73915 /ORGANISM="Pyrodinium bahamense, Strain pbaha01" /LENGTH=138 /DNA_ID=CAMNT_0020861307 /DNA_START=461 /DNA_END=878 /DNA_ORIENTATION=-
MSPPGVGTPALHLPQPEARLQQMCYGEFPRNLTRPLSSSSPAPPESDRIFEIVKLGDEEYGKAILDEVQGPLNTKKDWCSAQDDSAEELVDNGAHDPASPYLADPCSLVSQGAERFTQVKPEVKHKLCANLVLPCKVA